MTQEELVEFIKDNLRIKLDVDEDWGNQRIMC